MTKLYFDMKNILTSTCSFNFSVFLKYVNVLALPFELTIFSALSHNQYFPILGTSTSSIAPPTLSTKQIQETVLLEIRDLDIKKVLSQLSIVFLLLC